MRDESKQIDDQRELLLFLCDGNEAAADLIELLASLSQKWDDLIDGDITRPGNEVQFGILVNGMMWQAIVDLNENPFFVQYAGQLLPIMKQAIMQWQTANICEQLQDPQMLTVSYSRRSVLTDIAQYISLLCVGPEHTPPKIHALWHSVFTDQPIDDYINEHAGE